MQDSGISGISQQMGSFLWSKEDFSSAPHICHIGIRYQLLLGRAVLPCPPLLPSGSFGVAAKGWALPGAGSAASYAPDGHRMPVNPNHPPEALIHAVWWRPLTEAWSLNSRIKTRTFRGLTRHSCLNVKTRGAHRIQAWLVRTVHSSGVNMWSSPLS